MKVVFSEEQMNELRQLLDSGAKQTEIARHFKVTDDTIRRICRENGLTIRMPYMCHCIICGDTFYSNIRGAKTCKKEHHRTCVVCGNDFIVDRFNIKDTCSRKCASLLKYGTEYHTQSQQFKDKLKSTLMEKYGVTNVSQLPDHNMKTQNTCMKKYGAISYAGSDVGRELIQRTNLERYGCAEPLKDTNYRQKLAQVNLEKYGAINPMQVPKILHKQQETLRIKYGVTNPMQSDEIKGHFKLNSTAKYGVDWPTKSKQVKESMSSTCLERFGVPWACLRSEAHNMRCRSKLNIQFEALLNSCGIETSSEYVIGDKSFDVKVGDTLIELDPTITHNSLLSIFPDVEPKSADYHFLKSQRAFEHGFKCIHVFDWDSWDSICQLLQPPANIVYARDKRIRVSVVPEDVTVNFTSLYHIQGSCRGQKFNYGLYLGDELIQIMTFGRPRYNKKYDLELLRLCTKTGWRVVGGASKLFNYFKKENPNQSVISYCDLAKFEGNVYSQIGMKLVTTTKPAKIWSKGTEYVTDNYLRQRGYDQIFGTSYGKGTSNEELMIDNKWLPVYDCGQKVFEYIAK